MRAAAARADAVVRPYNLCGYPWGGCGRPDNGRRGGIEWRVIA